MGSPDDEKAMRDLFAHPLQLQALAPTLTLSPTSTSSNFEMAT